MKLEELKKIHGAFHDAKRIKIKADIDYIKENAIPLGTEVIIKEKDGNSHDPGIGVIVKRHINKFDFRIHYTIKEKQLDCYPYSDIELGCYNQDGFKIVTIKDSK